LGEQRDTEAAFTVKNWEHNQRRGDLTDLTLGKEKDKTSKNREGKTLNDAKRAGGSVAPSLGGGKQPRIKLHQKKTLKRGEW